MRATSTPLIPGLLVCCLASCSASPGASAAPHDGEPVVCPTPERSAPAGSEVANRTSRPMSDDHPERVAQMVAGHKDRKSTARYYTPDIIKITLPA